MVHPSATRTRCRLIRKTKAMSTAQLQARRKMAAFNEFVSSDFSALASHMSTCERSRGRLFGFQAMLEWMHAVASPRIVTTAAILAACGLGLLAFA
jgi:hypothetical protein